MSKWLDNAVFYEIYPQSFNDTNADGIGDFQGIIEKLDYIKELGCNAIWINPCFLSPFGDAGYDVADYCRVAPRYGTNEDLKRVFEEAHKRDMHVLLDLVPGHTSVEHPWFKESMKADRNEFTDRYVWTNNVWEAPEGMGSLRGISERDGACAINFFSNQPALNYGFYQPDPEKPWQQSFDDEGPQATLAAMEDVMRFWLNMGCDGFRVDMAGSLVKNDQEGKGTIRLWQQVRKFLDAEFPDAAMVSEWGEPDPEKPWQQSFDDEGPQATLAAMEDVMRFWLNMGCDGFRVDMAGSLVKNDQEGKGTIRLWQQVRKFLDAEFPDAAMVSEWGEPDKSLQGGFHMDFLLHFGPSHYNDLFRCDEPFFSKRGKGDISEFVETYKTNYNKTAQKGLICIPSGNHDMDRLARRLQGDELKIAFAFLLSMPGAPFIYYGDEIGMRYVEGLKSVEGGYNRTGSRSPMQWDDSTNAGFSSAPASDLYITMDPGKDRPTAKAQMADPDSLYHEVKKLIQIRQSSKALLSRGTIEFVYAEKNQYPLAYVREAEGEKVLVIINPSDKEQSFPYSAELKDALYTIGGKAESKDGTITIPAQSAGFYHI